MTAARLIFVAFCALFAASCGRPADVHWKDGNFEVYATDSDFTATKLGYNHHPGTLGLIAAEVVGAGSTEKWIFVERLDRASGRTEFYLVSKEGMPENHSGTVEGPFTAAEFQKLRASR